MTSIKDETPEEMAARHLQRQIGRVSARLHDIAERVELSSRDVDKLIRREGHHSSSYGWVAAQIVHEITSGLSNAPLEQLIAQAAEADEARLTPAKPDPS